MRGRKLVIFLAYVDFLENEIPPNYVHDLPPLLSSIAQCALPVDTLVKRDLFGVTVVKRRRDLIWCAPTGI